MTIPGISETAAAHTASLKPPHFVLEDIVRPNILSLQPYRCARDDYQEGILLDANENSLGHALPSGSSALPLNGHENIKGGNDAAAAQDAVAGPSDPLDLHRYPDPSLFGIKSTLAKHRNLPGDEHVFLGVGSDEVIDLIQRVVCTPGKDAIAVCPPTYGMYSVCAAVNDVGVVKVPLRVDDGDFSLDVDALLSTLRSTPNIKIIYLCSPGNPTGTLLDLRDVRRILDEPTYKGLVVVDEAYIDFAEEEIRLGRRDKAQQVSAVPLLAEYKNLVVSQTLSKAYGLAGIRMGIAYSSPALIQIMNNAKAPYNVPQPTAHLASLALSPAGVDRARLHIKQLLDNRDELLAALLPIPGVGDVMGGNDANFLLVQILDAPKTQGGKPDSARAGRVYKRMAEERGLVVRNRSSDLGCAGCLRITVGTQIENRRCVELIGEMLRAEGIGA
ncbi:putative histidinol-phosphate transaminase [Jaminaea rosea]|uniref:histidinol-phosphate transaminase n=1 Tax=Jaminaea rosea TaxID=1569628 RepID=A0A316UV28_9BASI|nr:putative histidinol-phosphate transaminase [Jaminaea rosea]PWN29082.1 putative histidinol-phosphate transaminase [Jaminaea rosea]